MDFRPLTQTFLAKTASKYPVDKLPIPQTQKDYLKCVWFTRPDTDNNCLQGHYSYIISEDCGTFTNPRVSQCPVVVTQKGPRNQGKLKQPKPQSHSSLCNSLLEPFPSVLLNIQQIDEFRWVVQAQYSYCICRKSTNWNNKKKKTFLGQRLTTIMLLPSLCCNPAISLVKHMLVDRGQVADLSRQE